MAMTTASPTAQHAAARAFNDAHPIGTPVRYWKGAREGDGRTARTRTAAQLLSGHTPDQHRHDDGQAADAASHDRALRELTVERDNARAERDKARAELGSAQELLAVVDDVTEQLDRARARYATRPEVTPVEPEHAHTLGTACPANGCRWPLPNAGLGSPSPRAQEPRPGQFCTEHFSWLCQAGQGRCQGKREG